MVNSINVQKVEQVSSYTTSFQNQKSSRPFYFRFLRNSARNKIAMYHPPESGNARKKRWRKWKRFVSETVTTP